MYLADFDYKITYFWGEDNTAADTLSCMPDATPNLMLVACALAYTWSPSLSQDLAAMTLNIMADESLLRDVTRATGYHNDKFAKQLRKDIKASSIERGYNCVISTFFLTFLALYSLL